MAAGTKKSASTPCTPAILDEPTGKAVDASMFLSRAASMLWTATRASPDLRFAASVLMQRAAAPLESDMGHLERVEQYLYGTQDLALVIQPESLVLSAHVDAAYAVHPNGRSHQGCALFWAEHLSWRAVSSRS